MSIGDDMANNKNKNQEELVLSILKKNQSLMKVLDYIDTLQIPDYYIAAGSIYQTIWNGLDHRDLNYGIKDIDVIYYNSNDLSVETDLKLYEKITEFVTKEKIPYTIDVSNEARMHIRKRELGGREIPPYKSSEDAISRFLATTHAIGLTKKDDHLFIYAPYGIEDILNKVARPIPCKDNLKHEYDAKVTSWQKRFPDIIIIPWPEEKKCHTKK